MEKIWLNRYPKGVPAEIDAGAYRSIVDLFEDSVRRFGDAPSFHNMGKDITFRELDKATRDFAAYLQNECGLRKGDRIAVQMPNLLQFPVAVFGALRAGLIVVNTNPLYTAREMRHQFKDAGVKAVVILANFASHLEQIIHDTDIQHVIVTEIGDLLGFPKRLIVNTVVKHVKRMVPAYDLPSAVSFNEALSAGAELTFQKPVTEPGDLAFLQYTGGTTGVSKGAMLTHRNIIANMEMIRVWIKPLLKEGEEVVISPLPMYHIFSLTVNCLAFMCFGGHNVLITNPKDIPGFIKELRKWKFTAMSGVNTLFNALMNHPEFGKIDFSSLKISVAGATALQTAVARRWMDLTKSVIVEGYGMTEASPVVACNPVQGENKVGTIGLPLPSTEVRLLDDDGREVEPGQPGEITVRGPQVMKGYWNRPEETANQLTPDGWLRTGDVGVVDADGYFKIVDRKKDMILVSGFNVYPNEIEDVLASHPGVLEAAAIGVPDEKSGEAVKVFVVRRDPDLDAETLKAYCREQLVAYKVPKQIEFRDELPKTPVGKILRRVLKDQSPQQAVTA